jgi:hypothetical protein
MWKYLKEDLNLIETSIIDCKDSFTREEYQKHCQLMLKSSAGIDFVEFFELIQHAVEQQLSLIELIRFKEKNQNQITEVPPNVHLQVFNLHRIFPVLRELISQPAMKEYIVQGEALLTKIQRTHCFSTQQ